MNSEKKNPKDVNCWHILKNSLGNSDTAIQVKTKQIGKKKGLWFWDKEILVNCETSWKRLRYGCRRKISWFAEDITAVLCCDMACCHNLRFCSLESYLSFKDFLANHHHQINTTTNTEGDTKFAFSIFVVCCRKAFWAHWLSRRLRRHEIPCYSCRWPKALSQHC